MGLPQSYRLYLELTPEILVFWTCYEKNRTTLDEDMQRQRMKCLQNVLVLFVSSPEWGSTPSDLQGLDVTKDRGFVKTRTDKKKYVFI